MTVCFFDILRQYGRKEQLIDNRIKQVKYGNNDKERRDSLA